MFYYIVQHGDAWRICFNGKMTVDEFPFEQAFKLSCKWNCERWETMGLNWRIE